MRVKARENGFRRWTQAALLCCLVLALGVVLPRQSIAATWTQVVGQASSSGTGSYTAATGSNRLMVVAVTTQATTNGTGTMNASFGGVALTKVVSDETSSRMTHTALFYLKDAQIPAGAQTLSVSLSAGSLIDISAYAAVLTGVDQTTPIADSKNYNNSSNVSSASFSTPLSVGAGDQAIYVADVYNTNSVTLPTVGTPSNWTSQVGDTGTYSNYYGWRAVVAARTVPTVNSTDSTSFSFSPSSKVSLSAMSLNAAPPCVRSTPTISVSPTAQSLSAGKAVSYTVTVTNNDSASCAPTTFALSASDSPSSPNADFVASSLSGNALSLSAGAAGNLILTQTAQTSAAGGKTQATTVQVAADAYHAAASALASATVTVPSGKLVYSNTAVSSTAPLASVYSNISNSFASATSTPAGAGQTFVVDKACPQRDEHIAGYVTSTGVLYIMRWDGTQWSNEWNVTIPNYDGVTGRRFDIDYRNSTGSAMVVYSTGGTSSSGAQFAYRLWDGSSWSAATTVKYSTLSSSGVVASMKVLNKPAGTGNGGAVMVQDSNGYLATAILDPTTRLFGNEKLLTSSIYRRSTSGDVPSFDMAYESATGELLTVFTQNSGSSIYYGRFDGLAWTTGSVSTGTSMGAIFAAADLRPSSNNILVAATASSGSSNYKVYSLVWNGSAFSALNSSASMSTSLSQNRMPIAGGFVSSGSTSAAVVVFNDGTANRLGYAYTTSGGSSWTSTYSTSVTIANGTKSWLAAASYPQSADTMMVTLADGANDLWAKRLVFTAPSSFTWTNADGGAALSASLATLNAQNFSFAYDRIMTILSEGIVGTTATVCPGSASQKIDGFSVATTSGSDTVSGLTVTTTNGSAIASMEIWDEAGTTKYFQTLNNTGSASWNFSGGTPIQVSPPAQNYKILVTYKGHGAAPVGASDTTAYVSALTSNNARTGSDFADTTITLDNAPAATPTWYITGGGVGSASLSWTPGVAGDSVVIVRYTASTDTTVPADGTVYPVGSAFGAGGTVVYQGSATSYTDNANGAMLAGGTYFYRLFELDACGNYSSGAPWASVGVTTPTPTVAGSASATVSGTSSISVAMPYSGDSNANNTLSIRYKQTSSSSWIAVTSGSHPASPLTAAITGLTPGASYDVQCLYADPDGITGTGTQTFSALTLPTNSTTALQGSVTLLSSSVMQVNMPYSNDFNANNSYTIRWKLSSDSSYPSANLISGSHSVSPFVATINGLTAQTSYDLLLTWNDPDGVVGSPQTLSGVITPLEWTNMNLLHNSTNTGSTKWAANGGWGVAGGKYGSFDCSTCHAAKAPNIFRIRGNITVPDTAQGNIPGGSGSPVVFQSHTADNTLGNYSTNGYTASTRICEVCHSQTSVHKYNQPNLARHEETVGIKDCTVCHKHNRGFKPVGGCAICHSKTQGKRAAVANQFNGNSHHIQGVPISDTLCYQCHWEANSDGSVNASYHGGGANPGAPVQLVIYKNGVRPTIYKNLSTAMPYLANGSRTEIQKLNNVCLGCHSAASGNAQPFGDGKTPKQYAWDGLSIDERYSQKGTTQWGKYSGNNTTQKSTVTKAISAHGNAVANMGGFDLNETWTDRKVSSNVFCYDCHNSHGSTVSGVTTSYQSATTNGGILKDTTAGIGGFSVTYKPAAGGSTSSHNAYNPGAGLCFDCHLNATSATTPWGYSSTFGSLQQIMGYMDTPYFGNGTFPRQQRYAYKSTANMGGHFGASATLSATPAKPIGGLCTPCHDPHGVTPTLGSNQKYGVPLLKGTWLTSPYKEDVTPADNQWYKAIGAIGYTGEYEGPTRNQALLTAQTAAKNTKHIDQNTFSNGDNKIMNSTAYSISETQDQFGGLCLGCHAKQNLTDGTTHTWKDKNRIHESVKGWKTANSTIQHNFPCAKCHAPHNASLPRLMAVNCMDYKHRGRVTNQANPVTSGSYRDKGQGGGHMPGSYTATIGSGWGSSGSTGRTNDMSFKCHEGNDSMQQWNTKTPWVK